MQPSFVPPSLGRSLTSPRATRASLLVPIAIRCSQRRRTRPGPRAWWPPPSSHERSRYNARGHSLRGSPSNPISVNSPNVPILRHLFGSTSTKPSSDKYFLSSSVGGPAPLPSKNCSLSPTNFDKAVLFAAFLSRLFRFLSRLAWLFVNSASFPRNDWRKNLTSAI